MFPYNSQGHWGPQRKLQAILHNKGNAADTLSTIPALSLFLDSRTQFTDLGTILESRIAWG